jgi:hypothetical protein
MYNMPLVSGHVKKVGRLALGEPGLLLENVDSQRIKILTSIWQTA